MASPDDSFGELTRLDKIIHEPARLALVSALSTCEGADFTYLQRVTNLSKGNLSAHLSTLEEGGIVAIRKGFAGRRPKTWASLTDAGRMLVDEYWQTMDRWYTSLQDRRTGDA